MFLKENEENMEIEFSLANEEPEEEQVSPDKFN